MKKKIIGGVAGLSALVAIGLASCGNGYTIGKIDAKDIDNLKEVVKENYDYEKTQEEKVEKDTPNTVAKSSYTRIDATKYTLNDNELVADTGLYVVTNEKGYKGIYSSPEGKFLVKPQYYQDFVSFTTTTTANNIHFININYGGKYDVYDEFGNEIAKGQKTNLYFIFVKK